MRKSILLIFCLALFPLTVYSQLFCIKTVDNRAVWDTSDINNKHWEDNLSTDSYYDGDEDIIENYLFNVINGERSNYEHNQYFYNDNKKIDTYLKSRFISNNWLEYYKKVYEYVTIGEKQYVSRITEYMTNGTELKPTQRKEYIYNENGKIDSLLFYTYADAFILATVSIYHYNNLELISNLVEYTNYDGVLEPSKKTGFFYNQKDLLINQTDSTYIGGDWTPVERILYEYYTENDKLKYTIWQSYFDNGIYKNFKRYTEYYHENGMPDLQTHALATAEDNNIFELNSQFRWEYDENWNNIATYYDTYLDSVLYFDTKYYTVSISDVKDEKQSYDKGQVYPNPANDFIMLKNINFDKAQLIDVNGKIVRDNIENASNINTNGLVPGTYFLRTFNGNKVNDLQFVISK